MSASFFLLLGLGFIWFTVTGRSEAVAKAILGGKAAKPSSSGGPTGDQIEIPGGGPPNPPLPPANGTGGGGGSGGFGN